MKTFSFIAVFTLFLDGRQPIKIPVRDTSLCKFFSDESFRYIICPLLKDFNFSIRYSLIYSGIIEIKHTVIILSNKISW